MAFNSSSYFVGVGTAFAAIAIGFAGGAMITTSTVQPPNRLERVAAGTAAPPSSAPSNATLASTASPGQASQQASVTTPAPQPQAAAPAPAAAVASAPANDSPPVQQPQPATPAVRTDAANIQPAPPSVTKAEDAAPARNERANVRPADSNREAARSAEMNREPSRKRGDERKFVERKRRQDLERQNLDEATNVVRQMPRDSAVDRVVDEDDAPRIVNSPPRRFGLFGDGEDSPRAAPPPRFGLFGN